MKSLSMETKNCPYCGLKPIEQFSFKNKVMGTHHSLCKTCHSVYRKMHYENNRSKYVDKAKRNVLIQRKHNYQAKDLYLESHPCVRCSESDPVILEFHHSNRADKEEGIAKMIRDGYSWKTILKEIAKCEVLCCNCHRKQTAIDLGWRNPKILAGAEGLEPPKRI